MLFMGKRFFKNFMLAMKDGEGEGDPSIIDPPAGGAPPAGDPPKTDPPAGDPPKEDGVDPAEFLKNLPEDLRNTSELQRVKSLEQLAKNYVEAQKMISGSGRMPAKDAPQEEWDAFYEKLGVPKEEAGYNIEVPKEYTESGAFKVEDSYMSEFKKFAKDKKLTNDQAQAALTFYADMEAKILESKVANINTEMASNIEELKKEWRGSYQDNINKINTNITRMFSDSAVEKLKVSGLLRDADFIKSLLPLTNMITGDTLYIEGQSVNNISGSLESKTKERDRLMAEDYKKNFDRVQELNAEIASLKQAQQQQALRRRS